MTIRAWVVVMAASLFLAGCGGMGVAREETNPLAGFMGMQGNPQDMMGAMTAKMNFSQEIMKNPDLAEWYSQREKMALAVGDRVFDKGFDRVFESMITALASLGCRVNNIERNSGYITASLPQLSPDQQANLRNEARTQYAQIRGYPASVLQKGGPMGIDMDMDMSAMMERGGGAGLTLSMVRQGARQTKVKLRFDGIYYPRQVDELYRRVWAEVDRQMFLDKALD